MRPRPIGTHDALLLLDRYEKLLVELVAENRELRQTILVRDALVAAVDAISRRQRVPVGRAEQEQEPDGRRAAWTPARRAKQAEISRRRWAQVKGKREEAS